MSAVSPLLHSEESDQPEGWAEIRLGDLISRIEAGKNLRCREQPPTEGQKGIIKISAVTWGEFLEDESKTLEGNHNFNTAWQIKPGDFLITRANTIELVGACVIVRSVNRTLMLSDKVLRLHMPDEWKEWLLLFLRSSLGRFQIENLATGNQLSMRNISQENLRRIVVPLPPMREQKRTIEKLRQLLSCVNVARERLANTPTILKRFRQAVLAAACSGRLTADWRETHVEVESAKRLIEKIKQLRQSATTSARQPDALLIVEASELEEIPDKWCWASFGGVIGQLRNGISTKPETQPPGNPILRISSVRSGAVFLEDKRFLPNSDDLVDVYRLRDGDLLFTRYNGSLDLLGVCGMVRGLGDRVLLYPDKLMRVRFDHPYLLPPYAEIFFQSTEARDRMTAKSKSSAGQQGISGADVKIQPIALPPLEEQVEIIRRVEAMFMLADAIEKRVAAATVRVEKLTQAILARAFRGELVPTEAKLARRANRSYETAADLLARIQSERVDRKQTSSLQKEKKWPTRSKRKTRNS
jgi:type I restriction enzyme S subunit